MQRKFRKEGFERVQIAAACGLSVTVEVRMKLRAKGPVVRPAITGEQLLHERAINGTADRSKGGGIARNSKCQPCRQRRRARLVLWKSRVPCPERNLALQQDGRGARRIFLRSREKTQLAAQKIALFGRHLEMEWRGGSSQLIGRIWANPRTLRWRRHRAGHRHRRALKLAHPSLEAPQSFRTGMDCGKQQSPRAQRGPINAVGRLRSQLTEFIAANNVIWLFAELFQPDRQMDEFMADCCVEVTPAPSAGSGVLVKPGYEEGIANARMKHGCARKKSVGESLVDEKKADFVARVLLTVCQ